MQFVVFFFACRALVCLSSSLQNVYEILINGPSGMHYLISIRKIRQFEHVSSANELFYQQYIWWPISERNIIYVNFKQTARKSIGNSIWNEHIHDETSQPIVCKMNFFFHISFFKVEIMHGSMVLCLLAKDCTCMISMFVSALVWFIQIAWWTLWVSRESYI